MTNLKNQPAFPRAHAAGYINIKDPDAQYFERLYNGMTLRQWYAGMAIQGVACFIRPGSDLPKVALDAFQMADAMLRFEEQEGGGK